MIGPRRVDGLTTFALARCSGRIASPNAIAIDE